MLRVDEPPREETKENARDRGGISFRRSLNIVMVKKSLIYDFAYRRSEQLNFSALQTRRTVAAL
jgi:hypothetical protein